ncbi:MAG: hypothetical protein H6937_02355 [Burkholderiales bacterium]|nr:hypothetical protein [Burkholderiales bacterium]
MSDYNGPERRSYSECPINREQAKELLASNRELREIITRMDKNVALHNQRSDIKDADHEKRLQAIEENQTCIIKNMREYKKYLFAGSVVLSVLASIGAAIWFVWDSRGEIAESIRSFIGIRPDENNK